MRTMGALGSQLLILLNLILVSDILQLAHGKAIVFPGDNAFAIAAPPLAKIPGSRNRFAVRSGAANLVPRAGNPNANPPITSVSDAIPHLTNPGSSKALFYTGSVMEGAILYAKSNGLMTIWEADKDGWAAGTAGPYAEAEQNTNSEDPTAWQLDDYTQFFINFSEAFAQLASGTVWLALPPDGLIPSNSILNQELVVLKASLAAGTVDKIMAVNLNQDEDESGNGTPTGEPYQYLPCSGGGTGS